MSADSERNDSKSSVTLDQTLRGLLVCPVTKQHLQLADAELVGHLAEREEMAGKNIRPGGFLITRNRKWAYPVVDGVPWLVEAFRLRLRESGEG